MHVVSCLECESRTMELKSRSTNHNAIVPKKAFASQNLCAQRFPNSQYCLVSWGLASAWLVSAGWCFNPALFRPVVLASYSNTTSFSYSMLPITAFYLGRLSPYDLINLSHWVEQGWRWMCWRGPHVKKKLEAGLQSSVCDCSLSHMFFPLMLRSALYKRVTSFQKLILKKFIG